MTGLDPTKDSILSIACLVTNADLQLLDEDGFEAIIHHDHETLDAMDEWCIKTHTASGLVDQCLKSKTTAQEAASNLLAYVQSLVSDKGKALLAGNSVHADKMFLMAPPWSQVLGWLHYRILDVSAIKEAVRRWSGDDVLQGVPRKALNHTAREDILESLEEARYYQRFFIQMRNPATTEPSSSLSPPGIVASREERDEYGNSMQPNNDDENNGTKRKATEAGIHVSLGDSTARSNGLKGYPQRQHNSRLAEIGVLQEAGGGYRTDVP